MAASAFGSYKRTPMHLATPRTLLFLERDGLWLFLRGAPSKWFAGRLNGLGGSVEVLAVSMDPTEIRNQVTAYLTRNRDIEGILALGPSAAEPTLAALEAEGLIGRIKLATFDLSPTVLRALESGTMDFAIDQQQFMQGYLPIVLLTLHHKYGLMPAADVLTGPGFVTPENAAQVIELSARGIR